MQVTMSNAPGISCASASAATSRYSAAVPDSSLCSRATDERLVAEVDAEGRAPRARPWLRSGCRRRTRRRPRACPRVRRPAGRSSRDAADSSCAADRTSRSRGPTTGGRARRTCRVRRHRRCARRRGGRRFEWSVRIHLRRSCQRRAGGFDRRFVGGQEHAIGDHPRPADPHFGDRFAAHGVDQVRHRIVAGQRLERTRGRRRSRRLPCRRRASRSARRDRARARRRGWRRAASAAPAAPTDRRWRPWPATRRARISPKRSRRLFDAAPSVPSATLTPAASSAATGAMPLPSFMFETGQCTTWQPCAESSRDVVGRQVHAVDRDELGTGHAEVVQPAHRRAPMLGAARGDLVRRLGEMRLDRQVELAREHDDLLPRVVAHGVRRVRRQREREARLVLQRVADREAAREVAVGVRRVGRREIEDRQTEHRAHAELEEGARAGVREEVHVVAAGDPAAQHFGRGEAGAVVDEIRRHESAFARPDVLLEPDLQRNVVGDAAKEAHRGVGVRVDEARQQHVPRQARRARALRIRSRGHRRWRQRRRCARRRRSASDPEALPAARSERSSRRRCEGRRSASREA